jgi:hypothetical protein
MRRGSLFFRHVYRVTHDMGLIPVGIPSRKCHKHCSEFEGLRVYHYLNEGENTLSSYCCICGRCSTMAIVSLSTDPCTSLSRSRCSHQFIRIVLLCTGCMVASSKMQQTFQLMFPVFTRSGDLGGQCCGPLDHPC